MKLCEMTKTASNTWFYAKSEEIQKYYLNKYNITKEPTSEEIYKIYLNHAFNI